MNFKTCIKVIEFLRFLKFAKMFFETFNQNNVITNDALYSYEKMSDTR